MNNESRPPAAHLQNGLSTDSKGAVNAIVKRVENDQTGEKFALIATPDSIYKSDITNPGSAYVNTFLAVRNKKTNTMKLIQVQEASFKHILYDSKRSVFENNVIDAKKALHKEFGGKKALASYERKKRTAPNIEVLEETLERQLDSIDDKVFENDIFDESQVEREKLCNAIFPDIDVSSGSSVRDVFTARKLLGADMVEHLAEVAIEVLQTDPKELSFANKYLTNSVRALQITKKPDSSQNIDRISLFIYMDALMRVLNCRKRTLDYADLSSMSDQVQRDVRKKFTMKGNAVNSKFTRQKSIIYYMILALISTETLEVQVDDILDGVDVNKTELMKYSSIIGAKIKNKTTLFIQKPKLGADQKLSVDMPSGKKKRRT